MVDLIDDITLGQSERSSDNLQKHAFKPSGKVDIAKCPIAGSVG